MNSVGCRYHPEAPLIEDYRAGDQVATHSNLGDQRCHNHISDDSCHHIKIICILLLLLLKIIIFIIIAGIIEIVFSDLL